MSKPIWWEFACNSGYHSISPTHVLFHEFSWSFSCDIEPPTSRANELKNKRLYDTFENGLHNPYW